MKYIPSEYEDVNTHTDKVLVHTFVTPFVGEVETKRAVELSGHSSQLMSSTFRQGLCLKKVKWKG